MNASTAVTTRVVGLTPEQKKAQYDLMHRVAQQCGFAGINPEFLTEFRDDILHTDRARRVAADAGVIYSALISAYITVMNDIRALFAPA